MQYSLSASQPAITHLQQQSRQQGLVLAAQQTHACTQSCDAVQPPAFVGVAEFWRCVVTVCGCTLLPVLQNLMREYMRNNDRALSNIEALPGGFNALRQLYENVQVGSAVCGGGVTTGDQDMAWQQQGQFLLSRACICMTYPPLLRNRSSIQAGS